MIFEKICKICQTHLNRKNKFRKLYKYLWIAKLNSTKFWKTVLITKIYSAKLTFLGHLIAKISFAKIYFAICFFPKGSTFPGVRYKAGTLISFSYFSSNLPGLIKTPSFNNFRIFQLGKKVFSQVYFSDIKSLCWKWYCTYMRAFNMALVASSAWYSIDSFSSTWVCFSGGWPLSWEHQNT